MNELTNLLEGSDDSASSVADDSSSSDFPYGSDDTPDQSISSDSESESEDDRDDNNNAGIAGIRHLHDRQEFQSSHCPPLEKLPMMGECDCPDFGIYPCILDLWIDGNSPINFIEVEGLARESANDDLRQANNLMRKQLYRRVFSNLEFNNFEQGTRRELPNCACARVRQIYPDISG